MKMRVDELHGRRGSVEFYVELGKKMLAEAGAEACESGYGTTDEEWVGRYALEFGDVNADGTLN